MTDEDRVELWAGYERSDGRLAPVWRMPITEARRGARKERQRMESRFRRSPIPLYGLPPSWEGRRFLGGASWIGESARERTRSLSLVHGVLVEGEGPIIVVESALPDEPGGGGPLRILAEELWKGRAASVPEAAAQLRARLVSHHDVGLFPLPSRSKEVVSVNEQPLVFDVLSQPAHWVAQARVGSYTVTIEGFEFSVGGLELFRVTDLDPYILGTRRFEGEGV